MKNLMGWAWIALQGIAGAIRSGLVGARGTTGGSGDFDGS